MFRRPWHYKLQEINWTSPHASAQSNPVIPATHHPNSNAQHDGAPHRSTGTDTHPHLMFVLYNGTCHLTASNSALPYPGPPFYPILDLICVRQINPCSDHEGDQSFSGKSNDRSNCALLGIGLWVPSTRHARTRSPVGRLEDLYTISVGRL